MNFTDEQRRIGKLLGIQVLDSQNDLNQITRAQEGAQLAGINVLDSANDLRQIEEYYNANQPAPTPDPTPDPTPTTPAELLFDGVNNGLFNLSLGSRPMTDIGIGEGLELG